MSTLPAHIYEGVMKALDLISQGYTPTKACDQARISTYWLKRAIADDALLSELAADAFERGYDTLADALLHIDTDATYGTSDPKKMKIISDNIKWYLEKRDNRRYGQKVLIENKITADRAIVDALARGKQRAIEATTATVVDAVAVELLDLSEFM